jgi:pyruvate dehydrogenase E2 component (dihydrolipoamide acetyltransferase)
MSTGEIYAITVPKWGMAMDEGTVVVWHLEEGALVAVGEEVLEIESTKAVSAIEAKQGGLLRRRVAAVGEVVPVGGLLGVIADATVSENAIEKFMASFQASTTATELTLSTKPQRVSIGDRRLNCLDEGTGPMPIILLHGFGGNIDTWLLNRPALAEEHRVICVDLPGHGDSDEKVDAGGPKDLAAAVLSLMDMLGIEQAHLVGHSLGGAVAISTAVERPSRVRSITLVASAGLGPEIDGEYISGFLAARRRRDLKSVVARLFSSDMPISDRMLEDLIRMKRVDGVEAALYRIAESFFPAGKQADVGLKAALLDIAVPYQVIWGRGDTIIPSRHTEGLSNVSIVDGAGHMPQMEQPAIVNRLILTFIRSLNDATGASSPA